MKILKEKKSADNVKSAYLTMVLDPDASDIERQSSLVGCDQSLPYLTECVLVGNYTFLIAAPSQISWYIYSICLWFSSPARR